MTKRSMLSNTSQTDLPQGRHPAPCLLPDALPRPATRASPPSPRTDTHPPGPGCVRQLPAS